MLIKEKIGTIHTFDLTNKSIDHLLVEWFETNKRILHKQTSGGKNVVLKFLKENPSLQQGDVLFADENTVIVVEIIPCDTISILPKDSFEIASLCYEIGNKHLPLYYQNNELLVPFEKPLFNLLSSLGYNVKREERKLLQQLKTTVSPHGNNTSGSLFSKILKLTTPAE